MRSATELALEFTKHIRSALRVLADEQPVLEDRRGKLIDRDDFAAFRIAGSDESSPVELHQTLHHIRARAFLGLNSVAASAGLDDATNLFTAVWAYALIKANPSYNELSQPCTDVMTFTGIVVTRQGGLLGGAAHNPEPLKEILTQYWGIPAGNNHLADVTMTEWLSAMRNKKSHLATPQKESLPELTPAFTGLADPLSTVLAAPLSSKEPSSSINVPTTLWTTPVVRP